MSTTRIQDINYTSLPRGTKFIVEVHNQEEAMATLDILDNLGLTVEYNSERRRYTSCLSTLIQCVTACPSWVPPHYLVVWPPGASVSYRTVLVSHYSMSGTEIVIPAKVLQEHCHPNED